MLAGKIIELVVLAAMLKDGIGSPVETGATGKIVCGPVETVAAVGKICGPVGIGATFVLTLDVMRAWICCSKSLCLLLSLPSNSRLIVVMATLSLCSSIGTTAVIADKRLVVGTGDVSDGEEATRSASSKSSIFALSRSDCFCARS